MFIFTSEDTENPKHRNERYLIELILYFAKIEKYKRNIAKRAGISHRTLAKKTKIHKELAFLKPKRKILTRYDKKWLWKTKEI